MKTEPIWDSTYRYRTFRLTDTRPKPLHAANGDHADARYIPQRIRLTYVDPQSDGNWHTSMVDVEGYNPQTLAPVFLHYKEPGFDPLPFARPGADWLPDWLRQIAIANLPGAKGDPGGVNEFPEPDDPNPAPAVALVTPVAAIEPPAGAVVSQAPAPAEVAETKVMSVVPASVADTTPDLFKAVEVKNLADKAERGRVTWGTAKESSLGTVVTPTNPVEITKPEEETQVLPKEDPASTQLLPQVEVDE